METLNLQDGEYIKLKIQAGLVKGYPQTGGELFLTNYRLVLVPNQLLSIGFGKRWEIRISEIQNLQTKKPFQGGPYFGIAGNRLVIILKDSSKHILTTLEDVRPLYEALSAQMVAQEFQQDSTTPTSSFSSATSAQNPIGISTSSESISQPGTIFPSNPPKEPLIAALLSLLLVGGAGQIYLGQVKKGIAIIVVSIALSFIGFGFIVWLLGVVDAYLIAKRLKTGNSVGEMQFF